jgi:hypothetical protein
MKAISNNTTQPLSIESLQSALDELSKMCDTRGEKLSLRPTKIAYIRPLWISEEDFQELLNTAYELLNTAYGVHDESD